MRAEPRDCWSGDCRLIPADCVGPDIDHLSDSKVPEYALLIDRLVRFAKSDTVVADLAMSEMETLGYEKATPPANMGRARGRN